MTVARPDAQTTHLTWTIVMRTANLLAVALLLFVLGPVISPMGTFFASSAYAEDDSDDGGDDDSDRGTAGGRSGGATNSRSGGREAGDGNWFKLGSGSARRDARPAARTGARSVERPRFRRGEIVTLSLSDADLAVLTARGYRVIEERAVPTVGIVARRLSIPRNRSLEAARAEVRALPSGSDADFNHFYRVAEETQPGACAGPNCVLLDLIGWSAPNSAGCAASATIGIIDTGINPDHPTFATARLEVHTLTPGGRDPSRTIHGTAVTALLIGDPASRSPGLLPAARVVAVDAFHSEGKDERADAFTLVAAMDLLAAKGIRVVNMSLAGPPNTALERAVAKLAERQIMMVSATGNVGPNAEPAYPAAYPDVVAVTAVDRSGRVYRRAGRGEHVDLAAPGVDIWTAAARQGARPRTGTSFAAPFVTAVAAITLAADPELSAKALKERLIASSRDLGAEGHDVVYGYGLVQAPQACPSDGNARLAE